ncbi:MAG: hypothetical protein QNJ81_06900 [Acidimicrobiia bacterium]|nr:hypothetical protein [Acidimicrobiia bacterium]
MRRRALEAAQLEWERHAVATLPSTYPDGREGVLRGPLEPRVMPAFLRFVGCDAGGSLRPASRRLEAMVKNWLHGARSAAGPSPASLAGMMAAEVAESETLVLALVGGAGVRWYTHYVDWRPDHTWSQTDEWEARLRLEATTARDYATVLRRIEEWLRVPESRWGYRSVLVGCPERDVVTGRWLDFATGAGGAPMPIVELGRLQEADDLFKLLHADAAKSPTLRELDGRKSHYFAAHTGPAGFVSFAAPDQVGHSSGFLDRVSADFIAEQRERLGSGGWRDVAEGLDGIRELVPTLHRFYDRARTNGFWVVHFGFTDELVELPREYRFAPV